MPPSDKTGLRGFRPGLKQTGLEDGLGLTLRIQEVEGLHYPCSENKGPNQLRGYREADLRLFFRICKNRFSHDATQLSTDTIRYTVHVSDLIQPHYCPIYRVSKKNDNTFNWYLCLYFNLNWYVFNMD